MLTSPRTSTPNLAADISAGPPIDDGAMRAARIEAPGRVSIVTVPKPRPETGQVRVRLEGCGVCASNLGPWAGPDWMEFPTAPGDLGHEGWGRIDAVGEGVAGLRPGQRVATLFQRAYAEFAVGPADEIIPLPDSFDEPHFPGEPLGCAMNIFARSDIREGQTVAIVGVGFLGALLVQLAKSAGARVIALSRRDFARQVARRSGADATLSTEDPETIRRVSDLTQGRLCDRVIEATGKQQPLDLAAQIAGVRARLVIAGYHQDAPRSVNMQLWNWRGLDVINAHERDPAVYLSGVKRAVEATTTGMLRPRSLITHVFPLEGLGVALDMTRDRPDGFIKAVVVP